MRFVFLSNYFNHHQQPLSDALASDAQYTFVATQPMDAERRALGWAADAGAPFVCKADGTAEYAALCQADAVIAGSAPEALVQWAARRGKLIFRYSERPLKNGNSALKYLPRLLRWYFRNPPWRRTYLLCASAFTAGDYAKFGLFRHRSYKWGYFPETRRYPDIGELFAQKRKTTILWCGRFLDWKHPDDVIEIARRLRDDGRSFRIELAGTGEMEHELKRLTAKYELTEFVHFLGALTPAAVREHMQAAGIYLFTSDRREGWGAVLNEAMNSACAVIASDAIGAVPYLVKSGVNGCVYSSGDTNELYEKLVWLLDNPAAQERLGRAAYETITSLWNAEIAAARLVQLSQAILDGCPSPDLFPDGPCSRAEPIYENWYKK